MLHVLFRLLFLFFSSAELKNMHIFTMRFLEGTWLINIYLLSTAAPWSSKYFTTEKWPWDAAKCKQFWRRKSVLWIDSGQASNKTRTHERSPFLHKKTTVWNRFVSKWAPSDCKGILYFQNVLNPLIPVILVVQFTKHFASNIPKLTILT